MWNEKKAIIKVDFFTISNKLILIADARMAAFIMMYCFDNKIEHTY